MYKDQLLSCLFAQQDTKTPAAVNSDWGQMLLPHGALPAH